MVAAYSVFANGGYRIQPFIVRDIRDDKGQVLAEAQPITAGDESLIAIDPRNAYLMDSMLRDVTIYGTGARASATLKRRDLAGKTGTTNEYVDAWFCAVQVSVPPCAEALGRLLSWMTVAVAVTVQPLPACTVRV